MEEGILHVFIDQYGKEELKGHEGLYAA